MALSAEKKHEWGRNLFMKKALIGLIMLALTLTLFPAAGLAEDVAWIGDTGYSTLEEAVKAATSGDTIKLGGGGTPFME